jgi:CelD/BcsL family acetyltransferase involved in cellulose biosynthesis
VSARPTVIDSPAEAERLAPEWRALAEARGNAFITPEWFTAALATTDRGATPAVHVLWDGGRLAGVLPLVESPGGLRFAGARLADRLEPACSAEDEPELMTAVTGAFRERPRRKRVLRLDRVDSEATWLPALVERAGAGHAAVLGPEEPLPYIPLEAGGDWDAFLKSRSRNFRSQVRRKTKALYGEHGLALRTARSPDEAESAIRTLLRLHDARWGAREGESSLAGDDARAFHVAFAVAAAERGWLRVHLLETPGGDAVAGWYGWIVGGRCSYYQAGFDPSLERASPGLVLLAESLRLAIEEGATEYDLLRGGEAFKSRFADHERSGRDVVLAPAMGRARFGAVARARLRRVWRRLPEGRRAQLSRLPSAGRW